MHDQRFPCRCGVTDCERELIVTPPFTTTGPVTLSAVDAKTGADVGIVLAHQDALRVAEIILSIRR